jgi:hypothetical protein
MSGKLPKIRQRKNSFNGMKKKQKENEKVSQ